MVLIAAAFSLRFFRFGGIAKMVGGGVAAGFVLYVATKLVGDLGGAGLLSATVAGLVACRRVASMLGALGVAESGGWLMGRRFCPAGVTLRVGLRRFYGRVPGWLRHASVWTRALPRVRLGLCLSASASPR